MNLPLSELRQTLPDNRIDGSAAAKAAFQSDGLTVFAVQPQAVVAPRSSEEVIQTVRWCHRHQIPFVARGSGTSLSGGSLPHSDGVVIALNHLDQILNIDVPGRTATVQTGVINTAVSKAVAGAGLHYAPDPSSQHVCTIGGNVAFNAGGAHCLKYGMTSNHVLGMRMLLADGTLVHLGSGAGEQIGPDVLGLMGGTEGLTGICLEICLKLIPIPARFHTVLAGYSTLEQAGEAVSLIVASGLLPAAMEIMDAISMSAATRAVGAEYPSNVEAVLIVELDGSEESVDAQRQQLDALLQSSQATEVQVAQSPEERLLIWKGRKSVFSAVGRLSPDFIVQDSVVPRSKLGFALASIQAISRKSGIEVANVFHAGDGNLHPLIMFDGKRPGELERAEEVAAEIVRLCIDLGGSITGEHGVGMEKRQFLSGMFDADSLDAMRRVRRACDPNEISNRGKMFPADQAPALSHIGLHPLEKAGIASRM